MIKRITFDSESAYFQIETFDDTTFAINMGHTHGGCYRLVHVSSDQLAKLALMLASVPSVNNILNAATALVLAANDGT